MTSPCHRFCRLTHTVRIGMMKFPGIAAPGLIMSSSGRNEGNGPVRAVQQILAARQYADCLFCRYIMKLHRHRAIHRIVYDQVDSSTACQSGQNGTDRSFLNADIESFRLYWPSHQHHPHGQKSQWQPRLPCLKNTLHE